MANIPTIPSVQQVSDPNVGVKVDSGPTQAKYRQLQQTERSAGDAVQEGLLQVAAYEDRKRKADEAYFFNKSFITWDKTTTAYAKSSKALPDDQVVPKWQEQTAQIKTTMQEDPEYHRMSEGAKGKLNLHFMDWQAKTTTDFQVEADLQASNKRWSTALAATNQSLTSDPMNVKRAQAILKAQAMDAPRGELDKMMAALPAMANIHQIINGSENNAPKTLAAMEAGQFKALNPTQYKEWHSYLKGAANEYYSNNTQNLYAKADPKTGIIPEEMIQSAIDGGLVQKKTGETMLATQRRQTYKEDDDNRKLLMAGVRNPDSWKTDPAQAQHDFLQEAGNIKNVQVRAAAISEINRQAASVAKTGKTSERPLEWQALEDLKSDPINVASREIKSLTEKLGDDYVRSDEDVKNKYGKSRTDVVRGYQLQEADQRDKMHQFFSDHAKDHGGQGPNEHEVEEFRQNLVVGPKLNDAATSFEARNKADPADIARVSQNITSGKPWYDGVQAPLRVKDPFGTPMLMPAANIKKALAAGWTLNE